MTSFDTRTTSLETAVVQSAERALDHIGRARAAIGAVIFGQDEVVEQALVTILAGGHGLLVGVPGLAKTKLVETLGRVLGLAEQRVQFTPDLLPADILGSEVLEEGADRSRSFRFIRGPVFTQLLMADEINRASPRTQSALLQAMQEHHVSVAGKRHDLPRPFHVLATQNPLEQEGTYPLPEAQLDRFLMQIDVHYPDRASERRVLLETTGETMAEASQALDAEELMATQRLVRRLPIGEKVVDAILDLVRVSPSRRGRRGNRAACRLGSGTARRAGADAGDARPRARHRPPRALDRRRRETRRAGVAPPHGAQFRRAPRDDRFRRGSDARGADRVTSLRSALPSDGER